MMRSKYSLVGSLLAHLMIATGGLASDTGVERYKNYTPEQLKAIPEVERKNSVPMMYILAAQKGLARDASIAIAMDLNLLMYPGVADYAGAIKMFQRDIGEVVTGTLTVSQIHKLTVRAEYQKLARVGFPTAYYSRMTEDSATVAGTMKIIDERIAWPVNYTTVSCYKSEKYCERWMTHLALPREDDWVRMYIVHEPSRDLFRITRWDNQLIDAAPLREDGKCRTTTLSFNFRTKEFFEITRNAGGDCEILGVKMPRLDKPRISQIVDGKQIVEQEFHALQKVAYDYLASSFRAQVDKAAKGVAAK
jgi:hypothetical protein